MKTFPLQRCILSWALVWLFRGTRVKSAISGIGTYMISTVVLSLPPPPHCLLRLITPPLFWTVKPVMVVVLWGGLSEPFFPHCTRVPLQESPGPTLESSSEYFKLSVFRLALYFQFLEQECWTILNI